MRTFTFYVEDRRYTVPNLMVGVFADVRQAREFAAERLAESPDHLSIEVREEDKLTFVLRRDRGGPTKENREGPSFSPASPGGQDPLPDPLPS